MMKEFIFYFSHQTHTKVDIFFTSWSGDILLKNEMAVKNVI